MCIRDSSINKHPDTLQNISAAFGVILSKMTGGSGHTEMCIRDSYFSIGKKTDTTDSTDISVTKQAGIYAGKEGYDIQVKGNTHLKGAVIDSKAPAEKNKLTTCLLYTSRCV